MIVVLLLLLVTNSAAVHVVVGGSGLSGMATGYYLLKGGADVTIYEALDQVGGRAISGEYAGINMSVAANWFLFENRAGLGLAYEVDCPPFLPLTIPKQLSLQHLILKPYLFLEMWWIGFQMAGSRDDYWNTAGAATYDNLSVAQWLQQKGMWDQSSKNAVLDWLYLMENYDFNLNYSMLHTSVMVYKRLRLLSSEGLYTLGLYRFEGGTGSFIQAIRNKIVQMGGVIHTGVSVTGINYGGTGVTVGLSNGNSVVADKVVVATSMTASANIIYTPALPPSYYNLFTSIHPFDDPAYQVILVYSQRWWLLEGNIILPDVASAPACGVWGQMFEVSSSDTAIGALRILTNPARIDCLGGLPNVIQSAKDWLKSIYITPQAQYGIDNYLIEGNYYDWREKKPYIPGVSYDFPANGSLVAWGDAMRTPINEKIYWAGSERAAKGGHHWMEGAIQRGLEVVGEIYEDLDVVPQNTFLAWVRYINNLAFSNYYAVGPIYNTLQQNLNLLSQLVCSVINASGFLCSLGSLFRVVNLNLLELGVWLKVQNALAIITQQDIVDNLAAQAAGLIYGTNGPQI